MEWLFGKNEDSAEQDSVEQDYSHFGRNAHDDASIIGALPWHKAVKEFPNLKPHNREWYTTRYKRLQPLIEKYGRMTEFNYIHDYYLSRLAKEDFKTRGELVQAVNSMSQKMYGKPVFEYGAGMPPPVEPSRRQPTNLLNEIRGHREFNKAFADGHYDAS